MITPEKEIIDTFKIKNESWFNVLKWLLTGGKFGKLFYIEQERMVKWRSVPIHTYNCRCVAIPTLKDKA